MAETRKLAAILAADVAGYSKLAGADEERTLARLRALRSDLIDPTIAVHHGRVVKRTGDGSLIEFRSVVDAVRCAIEVQNGMVERNAGLPPERRIEFRVGIHLGDVVEESDGDLMGDGVNIAARLGRYRQAGRDLSFRRRLSAGEVTARSCGQRSGCDPTQEHRRTGTCLFGRSRQAGARKADQNHYTKAAVSLRVPGSGHCRTHPIAVGAWYFFGANRPATVTSNKPAHLSIVVLPFTNLSGDPNQDYFADGITENLTTELSRIATASLSRATQPSPSRAKRSTPRRSARNWACATSSKALFNATRTECASTRNSLMARPARIFGRIASRKNIADLFKLQDQVVARLANTLGYELVKAEANRSSRSGNPDSIDLAMHGWSLLYRNLQQPAKEKNEAARSLFEQALTIDPNNSEALAGDATSYFAEFIFGWGNSQTDYDAKILGQSDRAIALAPDNLLAFATKSYYLGMSRRYNEAIRAADAGLAINPNYAPLYTTRHIAEMLSAVTSKRNSTLYKRCG